jgi:uncharacterized protein (DUF58 family)
LLPSGLGKPVTQSIEVIPPHQAHHWIYQQPAERRGIYRWQGVELRTGAPLGLFWCRRDRPAKARAIVYPLVLPLAQCPLIDEMGRDPSLQFNSDRRAQAATEGLTRSLRPYRWGDPTRLIHWRTSARYGELRIRELEIFTGGQELVIGLDSGHPWSVNPGEQNDFEQAVVAAASLYFYACRRAIQVKVWTAGSGLVHGNQGVLETLAETMAGEEIRATGLPKQPLIWLTQNPAGLSSLPPGSRWLLWPAIRQGDTHHPSLDPAASTQTEFPFDPPRSPGRIIHIHQPLQLQLQSPLDR